MNVEWVKCEGGDWCGFWLVNLDHVHLQNVEGVYVVWAGETTLYVGQGVIKDRLAAHRLEPDFLKYKNQNVLATWRSFPSIERDGVEAYLAHELKPILGEKHPTVPLIPVNPPYPVKRITL